MVVDDGLLWQEIFSLREKLKIAVAAIKSYDPDFDDREFTHRLNSVDYDQLMEELMDEGAKNTEQLLQPDTSCRLSKCYQKKTPDNSGANPAHGLSVSRIFRPVFLCGRTGREARTRTRTRVSESTQGAGL